MNTDTLGNILILLSIIPSIIVIIYSSLSKKNDAKIKSSNYISQISAPLLLASFLILIGSYFIKQDDFVNKLLIIIVGTFSIQIAYSAWVMSASRIRWATQDK